MIRTLWLASRIQRASPVKVVLLSVLIAIAMAVFLIVSELSRLSAIGLDEAIEHAAGRTGTYAIQISSSFGMSEKELAQQLVAIGPEFADAQIAERLPEITSDCPPYKALGQQRVLILRDMAMHPSPLPFGQGLPADSQLCYSGQVVPREAAYLPDAREQNVWGSALFVDPAYRDVVALATAGPITYQLVVVTGAAADQTSTVRSDVLEALRPFAERNGETVEAVVTVSRKDEAAEVRRASEAIKTVYQTISWGVLVLGGLALMISELIVVRQRTWFFGLARSMGARPLHVIALVAIDVATSVVSGTILAIMLAAATEPAVSSYSQTAFGAQAQLLRSGNLFELVVGGVAVLVLGSLIPALRAARQDPLNVLETSRN